MLRLPQPAGDLGAFGCQSDLVNGSCEGDWEDLGRSDGIRMHRVYYWSRVVFVELFFAKNNWKMLE